MVMTLLLLLLMMIMISADDDDDDNNNDIDDINLKMESCHLFFGFQPVYSLYNINNYFGD